MEEAKGVKHGKNDENNFCKCKQGTNFLDRFSPQETGQGSLGSNSQPPHEPDLNLRLSLGSFDSEGFKETHLTRSSSIDGVLTLRKESGEVEKSFLSLERSSSLPTEAEKEQRLIELQIMRRIEARNRLVERQRSFNEGRNKETCVAPETMPTLPPPWSSPPAEKSPALRRAIFKIKPQQGYLAESNQGTYFPLMSPATSSLHGTMKQMVFQMRTRC